MKHSLAMLAFFAVTAIASVSCDIGPYVVATNPTSATLRDNQPLTIQFSNMAGWNVPMQVLINGVPIEKDAYNSGQCPSWDNSNNACVITISTPNYTWLPVTIPLGSPNVTDFEFRATRDIGPGDFSGACSDEMRDKNMCLRQFRIKYTNNGYLHESTRLLGVRTMRVFHRSNEFDGLTEAKARTLIDDRPPPWAYTIEARQNIEFPDNVFYNTEDVGSIQADGSFIEPVRRQPVSIDDIFAQCITSSRDPATKMSSIGGNPPLPDHRVIQRRSMSVRPPLPVEQRAVLQFTHLQHIDVEVDSPECAVGREDYVRALRVSLAAKCRGPSGRTCIQPDNYGGLTILHPEDCNNGQCDYESTTKGCSTFFDFTNQVYSCYNPEAENLDTDDNVLWLTNCLDPALYATMGESSEQVLDKLSRYDILVVDDGGVEATVHGSNVVWLAVTGSNPAKLAATLAHEIQHRFELPDHYAISPGAPLAYSPWPGFAPCAGYAPDRIVSGGTDILEGRNVLCSDGGWLFPINQVIELTAQEKAKIEFIPAAEDVLEIPPDEFDGFIVNHCDWLRAKVDAGNRLELPTFNVGHTHQPMVRVSTVNQNGGHVTGYYYNVAPVQLRDYNRPINTDAEWVTNYAAAINSDPAFWPSSVPLVRLSTPTDTGWVPPDAIVDLSDLPLNNDFIAQVPDAVAVAQQHPLSSDAIQQRVDWILGLDGETDLRPLRSVVVRLIASEASEAVIADVAEHVWARYLIQQDSALRHAAVLLALRAPADTSSSVIGDMLISPDFRTRWSALSLVYVGVIFRARTFSEADRNWLVDRLEYAANEYGIGDVESSFATTVRGVLAP